MRPAASSHRSAHDAYPDRRRQLQASPRLFANDMLDRLSRVHPAVPPVIFVPVIAVLEVAGVRRLGGGETAAWFVLGYVVWTLVEYWMHRLVFHFEPQAGVGARLHWIIHGIHHEHPGDPLRLVMPPSVSLPLAALFYGLFAVTLGGRVAPALAGGFLAGYLVYDMTHYYLHHARPRRGVGRLLRELHMRHHFQDDTRGFGVSAPYWDHVFGTAPRRRARPRHAPDAS